MDNVLASVASIKVTKLLAERPNAQCKDKNLVCLNFKVPMRIRQQFKVYAARHDMTMTDLLLRLVDDCLSADALTETLPQSQNKK